MTDAEPSADALARAVRGLALTARSLERAAGDLTLSQYRVLAFVAAGHERSSLVAEGLALATPTVIAGDRRALRLAVTDRGAVALRTAEESMGDRLDSVLRHAPDPEALLRALCDLDDAIADRMRTRMRGEVRA